MRITDVRITPVAVADPPLLNAVGVHQPYALRAVLEVTTDEGLVGLSETYGDAGVLERLEAARERVIGLDPFALNTLDRSLRDVTGAATGATAGTATPLSPGTLADRIHATLLGALEVAALDLQAKACDRPVVDLLGGKSRDSVPFAAYLFYKLPGHYGQEADGWGEARDAEGIVTQASRMVDTYGFESLKLKGGVLDPADEIETVRALREAFPQHPLRIDPNTAWRLETAHAVATALEGTLEYLEDPVAGLDDMAALARRLTTPLATNMAVTCFGDLPRNAALGACQVILSDHHFWGGLQATRHLAAMCATWGMGMSMHSNSHLGISFAAMVHLAAALPWLTFACDTHQPWQEEDVIAGGKLPIVGGCVRVPDGPGLGVELDPDELARLHDQYQRCGIRARDDVGEMRRHDPAWTGRLPRL